MRKQKRPLVNISVISLSLSLSLSLSRLTYQGLQPSEVETALCCPRRRHYISQKIPTPSLRLHPDVRQPSEGPLCLQHPAS